MIEQRNLIDIRNYWLTLNVLARDARLAAVKQADLEREAFDLELIVYRGKLISPSDYPCLCSKISPDACFEDDAWMSENCAWTREERRDRQCHCPCHQYWWPD